MCVSKMHIFIPMFIVSVPSDVATCETTCKTQCSTFAYVYFSFKWMLLIVKCLDGNSIIV